MVFEVVILGGGPAGTACALELFLHGIKFALMEGDTPGGLLNEANTVYNLPFFKEPVRGREIGKIFEKRLRESGCELINEECTGVFPLKKGFSVHGSGGERLKTNRIVIATGSRPLTPPAVFTGLSSRRIHTSLKTMQNLERGRVVVVGGGDTAYDYALSLEESGFTPIILYRRKIRANSVLCREVKGAGIDVMKGEAHYAEEFQSGLKVRIENGRDIECSYIFSATGRTAKAGFENVAGMKNVYTAGDAAGLKMCANECSAEGTRAGIEIAAEVNCDS